MNTEIINKYINGTASEEERNQVMQWMREDNNNINEVATLRRLHEMSLWNQNEKTEKHKNLNLNLKFRYHIVSAVAILALIFGVSFYYLAQSSPEIFMQTINVPAGQRVELVLADGTTVWLNAGTSFSFPTNFSEKSREVLLDGEGYFDVKKEEKRDFIVKTSTYDIKVLGTTFNVMAYSKANTFEVSLLKGSVEISSAGTDEKIMLEPSMRAYLENSKLIKSTIAQYNNFLWKDGIIYFDDEPFQRMMAKLELYFDTKITIENPSLLSGKYTGKFRTKDGIEHILRVIQRKETFVYEKDHDKNMIMIR